MSIIYHTTFRAMGCEINIQLETDGDGAELLTHMPDRLEAMEAALSRFRSESELMHLNARAGAWTPVSETLFEVVHAAKHAARLTDGLYHPLVLPAMLAAGYDRSFERIDRPVTAEGQPAADWREIDLHADAHEVRLPADSAIDAGGIAKGWAAAKLADDLSDYGPCLVDLGGDIAARGAPADLPGWPVDVEAPDTGETLVSLLLRDTSITTSGIDYRRWQTRDGALHHHIIDPRTGCPADTDVQSVTIIHPHAPTAEAYAKALLLMGSEHGLEWLNGRWNAAGLVVRQDNAVLATTNFITFMQERIES